MMESTRVNSKIYRGREITRGYGGRLARGRRLEVEVAQREMKSAAMGLTMSTILKE
jgi:hypothetical protein